MLIYKATNTLDAHLPLLNYTTDKTEAEMMIVGGKKFALVDFPKLKGIFKTGVGTDNLPFDEATARGVAIELPSKSTCDMIYEETAAFTCHLILSGLYDGVGVWESWTKVDRPALHYRRLLVVGTGKIGQRVVEKMQSFMEVDTYDSLQDAPETFEEKARRADCVTLHVPLLPETTGLFNSERLSWLKDGALLVNTARGPVIDEAALYAELASGRLRAACDVFWQEPYSGKLTALSPDRFIRSPHIASTCHEFTEGAAQDFLNFFENVANASEKDSNK